DATTNAVTVGSSSGGSATAIQAGTGNLTLATGAASGASGTISIMSGASSTVSAGNVSVDTGTSTINGTVIENDTFESGTNGWGASFDVSSLTQSTAQAHGGTHSLAIVSTGVTTWGIGSAFPGPSATAGHFYNFTAWVRGTSAQPIRLISLWQGNGSTTLLN